MVDHSRDVPPHTHGGTDAPECITCGAARPPTPDYKGEMMQVKSYVRRPFNVDAVQVTEEDMEAIAKWCGGDVRTLKQAIDGVDHEAGSKFIKVRVYRPMGDRQTMAFVGDWVLYAGKGYKVYTDPAFTKTFESSEQQEHDRSAITGQFVSAKDAEENPNTTVHESGSREG